MQKNLHWNQDWFLCQFTSTGSEDNNYLNNYL